MQKGFWPFIWISFIFILLISPFFMLGWMLNDVSDSIEDIGKKFSHGHEDSEIIAYVKDTHDLKVEVIHSAEKSGKGFQSAVVRTLDNEKLEFQVHVNFLGKISGDTYNDVKKRYKLDRQFANSEIFRKLSQIGFHGMTFKMTSYESDFYMEFPPIKELADIETFELLYEAVPLLKELNAEISKQEYELEKVVVGYVTLDIDSDYKSAEDLGNKLAANNIDAFTHQFYEDDLEKLLSLEPTFKKYKFEFIEDRPNFKCYEMQTYTECHAYSFSLEYKPETNEGFLYDSNEDREALFSVIKEVQKLDIPIGSIKLSYVEMPEDPENQIYSRKELKEMKEVVGGARYSVWINDIQNIKKTDDIYFEKNK